MSGETCTHTPRGNLHADGKYHFSHSNICSTCGATWQIVLARKGKKVAYIYNGELVTGEQYQVLATEGPKGEAAHLDEPVITLFYRLCAQQGELCPEILEAPKRAPAQKALL